MPHPDGFEPPVKGIGESIGPSERTGRDAGRAVIPRTPACSASPAAKTPASLHPTDSRPWSPTGVRRPSPRRESETLPPDLADCTIKIKVRPPASMGFPPLPPLGTKGHPLAYSKDDQPASWTLQGSHMPSLNDKYSGFSHNAPPEMITFLNYWLDKEIKRKFQHMDDKLDLLLSEVLSRRTKAQANRRRARSSRISVASCDSVSDSSPSGIYSTHLHRSNVIQHHASGDIPFAEDFSRPAGGAASGISAGGDRIGRQSLRLSRHSISEEERLRKRSESALRLEAIQKAIDLEHGRGHLATQVWRFLENPHSSFVANAYSMFVQSFVIMSVFISCIQTVKDSGFEGDWVEWLQTFCEILYASELTVRFVVCPDRCHFWLNVYNWIDLVSALPIFVRFAVNTDEYKDNEHPSQHWAHSVVATVPLVRLLKLIRRFEKFHLLLKAWKLASEALPVLLFTLMIIALFFSVVLYFVEPISNIGSLPVSLYFVVVTMTTVGYGDITPDTVEGHFIATILMIVSSLYMAIPIGIVGHAFSEVWGNRDRLLLMHRMRDAFLQEGYSAESMSRIVSLFDEDGDGELAVDEFRIMLQSLRINFSDERVLLLHESIDKDGGGTINVGELINSLFPKAYTQFWRDMADGTLNMVRDGVFDNVQYLQDFVWNQGTGSTKNLDGLGDDVRGAGDYPGYRPSFEALEPKDQAKEPHNENELKGEAKKNTGMDHLGN